MTLLFKPRSKKCTHSQRFYELMADGSTTVKNVPKYKPGDKIVLDDNLTERIDDMMKGKYLHAPWRSLCCRRFLVDNEILFTDIKPYEDVIRGYALLLYAKRFVRVPKPIYLHRRNQASIMRSKRTPVQNVCFWLNPLIFSIKILDEVISRHEVFKENLSYRYAFLNSFVVKRFLEIFDSSLELNPSVIYDAIKKKFARKLGEFDVLIPALCTALNTQQRNNALNVQKFNQFAKAANKRIAQLEAELKRLQS